METNEFLCVLYYWYPKEKSFLCRICGEEFDDEIMADAHCNDEKLALSNFADLYCKYIKRLSYSELLAEAKLMRTLGGDFYTIYDYSLDWEFADRGEADEYSKEDRESDEKYIADHPMLESNDNEIPF